MAEPAQFVVHPVALRGYAGLLERNAGHVSAMKQHLVGWGYLTADLHGVLGMFVGEIERIADWQCDLLDRIHGKLGDTVRGLEATADTYARTDAGAAADLDRQMPTAPEYDPSGKGAI